MQIIYANFCTTLEISCSNFIILYFVGKTKLQLNIDPHYIFDETRYIEHIINIKFLNT